jgi:hypothetical protein
MANPVSGSQIISFFVCFNQYHWVLKGNAHLPIGRREVYNAEVLYFC